MTLTYRFSTVAFVALGALTLMACGQESGPPIDSFISDDPHGSNSDGDEGDPNGTGGDEGGDAGDGDGDGDGVDISEADIIQVEGDRLYALSTYSGLTVVDIQNPDDLRALGNWETDAEPFEMYVEAGRAFVMFNDYGFWEWDELSNDWSYASSSRLVALDASDPAAIAVRGDFTLPGRIQDSRRVGDILYLVTLEDGWCWGCDNGQTTVITSLDISDEAHPAVIDQLELLADNDSWDWQRSVESTTERMYLASRTWDWEPGGGSVIDVVDISAGDGSLTLSEQVAVEGSVFSRWQMNEYEGVLRVISQRGWTDNPLIETFTIVSSAQIEPLGSGELTIPEPESLRSARFDGDRAYAITAEQIDPLFTIDLSDPADPKQAGELEIPGWVYHMEPRGDRILALGFDPAHPDGSVNVSLFDVSDFANPSLRRRVHFGGDWASFAEDQNRIHKAFTILEDEQMLLVPHTGWDFSGGYECSGNYRSGVQLIDWKDDDLTLRGVAPARGRVRRAFTHAQRLLTVSDTELASFDYADRDNPATKDTLALAVHVDNLVRVGEVWVRVARSWYTSEQLLEVVDGDDPGSPEPLGVIDLAGVGDCEYSWIEGIYPQTGADGEHVFVVQSVYSEDWDNDHSWSEFLRVTAVDISNPSAPSIVDTYDIPGQRTWGYGQLAGVSTQSSAIAHQPGYLAFLTRDPQTDKHQVEVLDLSDPTSLELVASLERPAGQTQGEFSVMSDTIVSWHTEPVEGQPGKVRFYFDRLDLAGATPKWATKINVPGIIVAYDAEQNRAFTVDFSIHTADLSVEQCYTHPKYWRIDWDPNHETGTCYLIERSLERLSISGATASSSGSFDIEGDAGLVQLYATDSRIFAKVDQSSYDYVDESHERDTELVIVDIASPTTTVARHDGEGLGHYWWITRVEGERAVIRSNSSGMALVDATEVSAPIIHHSTLPGWGGCYNPILDGDTLYCPMGPYGLETIEW
jgi:hypothetical protein